jgi:hypothetical protein
MDFFVPMMRQQALLVNRVGDMAAFQTMPSGCPVPKTILNNETPAMCADHVLSLQPGIRLACTCYLRQMLEGGTTYFEWGAR